MKMKSLLVIVSVALFILSSCTPQRKLIYLRKIQSGIYQAGNQNLYKLQPGDLLSINVYSANEKAAQLFSANRSINQAATSNEISAYLYGFIVTDSGYVNLPLAGKINVVGLSLNDAGVQIEQKIQEYFFDAVVDVKLMSFQITVLGEVNKPGTYTVLRPKLNIFEAVALAGDLNVYGKREIVLLRETIKGYEVCKIDLNDKNLIKNEYFYLLPNDIIYVEPHKAKTFGANAIPNVFNTVLSSLSIILVIINLNQ